jgi:peptide chain release factor 2
MQPYQMVKDHRTKFSVGDPVRVLDGDLDPFIQSYLLFKKTGKLAAHDAGEGEEE